MLQKQIHEIRDPIHLFVKLDSDERRVLDSRPMQRLRHVHQLGMSYLVYPSATHKRFEHSIGVMELATRIFDTITNSHNLAPAVRAAFPELSDSRKLEYWRSVLRVSALCHDIGHLPFSHVAERDLLPEGWDHERITSELILSREMLIILNEFTPPIRSTDVAKLAIGPRTSRGI